MQSSMQTLFGLRFYLAALLAVAPLLALAGCAEEETIQHYQAMKPEVLAKKYNMGGTQGEATRMLGAIVPYGDRAWFFKLTGPVDKVAAQAGAFEQLVGSLKFAAPAAPPSWTLPQGWVQLPGSQFRFATLKSSNAADAVETSVTTLGWDVAHAEEGLLANVNRWRGQLGLPDLRGAQLADNVRMLEVGNLTATLVDFEGKMASSSMPGGMTAPFASGNAPQLPQGPVAPQGPPAPAAGAEPFKYEKPADWKLAPNDTFSALAFSIEQGNQSARFTASSLAAAAGAFEPNVNRWRGQVGLPALGEAELDRNAQPIEVGGVAGKAVELIGSDGKSMLGAIVIRDNEAWFFKVIGSTELVVSQKASFNSLLKSIKFE